MKYLIVADDRGAPYPRDKTIVREYRQRWRADRICAEFNTGAMPRVSYRVVMKEDS